MVKDIASTVVRDLTEYAPDSERQPSGEAHREADRPTTASDANLSVSPIPERPYAVRIHEQTRGWELFGLLSGTASRPRLAELDNPALRPSEPKVSEAFELRQGAGLALSANRMGAVGQRAAEHLTGASGGDRFPLALHARRTTSEPLLLTAMAGLPGLREYAAAFFVAPSQAVGTGFSSASSNDAARTLADEIAAVIPDDTSNAGAKRLLLSHALFEASHGHPGHAADTLRYLTERNLGERLARRGTEGGRPAATARTSSIPLRAWRAAQMLSRSQAGYDTLEHIQPGLVGSADQPRYEAMRVLLQASDELASSGAAPYATPERIARSAGTSSAAGSTFSHCAARAALKLWQEPQAVQNLPRTEKNAFFAWRHGFREDGPGTPLTMARTRLMAMAHKWIPRAAGLAPHSASTPPMEGERETPPRWRRLADRIREHFGQAKSPLSSLPFGTLACNARKALQTRFDTDLRTALDALSAFMNDQLPCEYNPERMTRYALDAAKLEFWKRRLQSGNSDMSAASSTSMRPSTRDAMAIVDHAERILMHAFPNPNEAQRTSVGEARRQILETNVSQLSAGFSFKLETLKAMRQALERPARVEDVDSLIGRVDAALERAERTHRGDPLRPESMTMKEIGSEFKQIVDTMPPGQRVRFSAGAVMGLNNASLLVPIVPHLVAAGPQARATGGRHAIVEFGAAAHAGELFLGTEQQFSGNLGMTLSVGPNLGPAASISASLAANAGGEISQPRGLMLRARIDRGPNGAPRVVDCDGQPKDEWRVTLGNVVEFMLQQAHGNGPTGERTKMWDDFVDRFFDDRTLTLSWQDQSVVKSRIGVNASANAGVGVPATVKLGGKAGAAYEYNPTVNSRATNQGGLMQRQTFSSGMAGIGTLSASTGLTIPQLAGADPVHDPSLASVPMLSTSATFGEVGHQVAVTLTQNDGRYVPELCYRDVVYRRPDDYVTAIKHNDAAWRQLLGGEALDAHLSDVERGVHPAGFTQRWFLHPDAANMLDQLTALSESLRRIRPQHFGEGGGDRCVTEIDAIRREIDGILNRESSWRPLRLLGGSQYVTQRNHGLNYFAMAQHQLAVRDTLESFSIGRKHPEIVQAVRDPEGRYPHSSSSSDV